MIRPSSLIASLAIAGFVCLSPLEAQKSLSEKANLQIEQLRYDGPHVNPSDYNTMSLYVRATVAYNGDLTILENSRLIAGCWMNTELASAEHPGKQWWDWGASCFNNDYIYSPDFPRQCGEHLISIPLTPESRRLGCQNGAPAMPRCFQSTKPNRFVGWASGGAFHLKDGPFFNDVGTRQALPTGEISCHRHFRLRGLVEGLEPGESLQFHADVPDPVTGVDKPWDRSFTATSDSSLSNAPQIAEGATYKANITFQAQKKDCTFKRNGSTQIQATFTNVDDQGRTPGGLDLTDLSIACICKDGQASCPPDATLFADTWGLENGESVNVKVELTLPNGQKSADTYAVNRNGETRLVDNVPGGSSYSATVAGFDGRSGVTCTLGNPAGEIGAEKVAISIDCSCGGAEASFAGASRAMAGSTDCGLPPGGFFDLVPEVQVFDICQYVERLCPTLDPWWWNILVQGTGGAPCQRQTVCVDGPRTCWTDPETGEVHCAETLICKDKCVSQSQVVLAGPYVSLDGDLSQPLSGRVLLSGWASDQEGIQLLRLYLDGSRSLWTTSATTSSGRGMPPHLGRLCADRIPGRTRHDRLARRNPPAARLRGRRPGRLPRPDRVRGRPRFPQRLLVDRAAHRRNSASCRWSDGGRHGARRGAGGGGERGGTGALLPRRKPRGHRLDAALPLVVGDDGRAGRLAHDPCRGARHLRQRRHDGSADRHRRQRQRPPAARHRNAHAAPPALRRRHRLRLGLRCRRDRLGEPAAGGAEPAAGLAARVGGPVRRVQWLGRGRSALSAGRLADELRHHAVAGRVVRVPGGGGGRAGRLSLAVDDAVDPQRAAGAAHGQHSGVTQRGRRRRRRLLGRRVRRGAADLPLAVPLGELLGSLFDGNRGGRVSGAATDRLELADVVVSDQTSYRCVVANEGGTTASSAASLTVNETIAPPTATAGLSQQVTEGETAYLSVAVQGVDPLAYQWQKWIGSWIDLADDGRTSGSKTEVLTIASTGAGDGGSYRCRVSNAGGTTFSEAVDLTVDPVPVGTCQESSTTLCFQANRFAVTATVNGSAAVSMPFSQEGGFFWIFEPQTVEVVVKILDGTSANGYFWVFHGSLTDLAYTVTVTDTISGVAKTYLKDAGHFCGDADTAAFHGSTSAPLTAGHLVPLAPATAVGRSSTACASSPSLACLLNGKFGVEVLRSGWPQPGVAVTGLSASFGFVTATAPEVVVKVIDGTSVNGWYWLFFGSLTHQDFTVRVTDSATGEFRTYVSPGQFCGGADTAAF
jgi:hypothetical protein